MAALLVAHVPPGTLDSSLLAHGSAEVGIGILFGAQGRSRCWRFFRDVPLVWGHVATGPGTDRRRASPARSSHDPSTASDCGGGAVGGGTHQPCSACPQDRGTGAGMQHLHRVQDAGSVGRTRRLGAHPLRGRGRISSGRGGGPRSPHVLTLRRLAESLEARCRATPGAPSRAPRLSGRSHSLRDHRDLPKLSQLQGHRRGRQARGTTAHV